MALTPLNDYAKIKLDEAGTFSAKAGDAASSGILVEVPNFVHYGMYSMAFEQSLMNEKLLSELISYWEKYVGNRVYWLALSEKGAILQEEDGTKYCYVKFTSLMAVGEADKIAENVTDQHGGSFSV